MPKTEATDGLAAIITARTNARPRKARRRRAGPTAEVCSPPLLSPRSGSVAARCEKEAATIASSVRAGPLNSRTILPLAKTSTRSHAMSSASSVRVPDQGAALTGELAAQAIEILLGRRCRRRGSDRRAATIGVIADQRPRHQGLLLIAAAELAGCANRIAQGRAEVRSAAGPAAARSFRRKRAQGQRRGPTRPIDILASTLHSGNTPSFCRSPETKLAGAARVTTPAESRSLW